MKYRIQQINDVFYVQHRGWSTLWMWTDIRIVTGFYDSFVATKPKQFNDLHSAAEYIIKLEQSDNSTNKKNIKYYYVENGKIYYRDSDDYGFRVE